MLTLAKALWPCMYHPTSFWPVLPLFLFLGKKPAHSQLPPFFPGPRELLFSTLLGQKPFSPSQWTWLASPLHPSSSYSAKAQEQAAAQPLPLSVTQWQSGLVPSLVDRSPPCCHPLPISFPKFRLLLSFSGQGSTKPILWQVRPLLL
jgi:hypothetical protein